MQGFYIMQANLWMETNKTNQKKKSWGRAVPSSGKALLASVLDCLKIIILGCLPSKNIQAFL